MTEDPVQKPDPYSDWVILGSNIFDEGGIGLVLIGMPGIEKRQTVLDAAYHVHPERFVRQAPKPAVVPTEVWINKPLNTNEKAH